MNYLMLSILGIFSGVLAGLFGIGGGIIVVPALVYFFHYSQHEAQGTSLAMLLPPIGLLAVWRYWQAGNIKILPALILAIAFMGGALLGANIAIDIPELTMKRIFGVALVGIGSWMILGR